MSNYEGTAECTMCEREVDPATLVAYGDYELCKNCQVEIKRGRG